MKKYFFMAVAAIAALSSCSNYDEFEQNQTGNQGLVFTATMEGSEGTRAILDTDKDNKKFAAWEAGDKISINGKTYSAKEGGVTAIFKADGEDATGPIYAAYFPANLSNGTLPAIQTYEPGKFNMPMYAESTTTELQFKNLCAVLAIKVTSADIATLKSIKVASDVCLNGDIMEVKEDGTMTLPIKYGDKNKVVVLESKEALTLTEEGTVFYIAIPAQEYKYLNIYLSSDGETYTQAMATKKVEGIGEIGRSTIFNIDYKKNATKLWEGNVFVADCNLGAKSATEYGDYYDGSASIRDIWGSNWNLPTKNHLEKLNDLGAWDEAKKGLLCTSTTYPGNSVFLPAAGHQSGGMVVNDNVEGCYWSWTSSSTDNAPFLQFNAQTHIISYEYHNFKYSFRPLLTEAASPVKTTGTAKAKIDGKQVDVKWVQLWTNGPKFAEYNVEDGMSFTDAIKTGEDYIWGAKWKTPSKDELSELVKATSSTGSNKITFKYEQVNGVWGITFTGKGTYATNSVFFPATGYFNEEGMQAPYWTSTACDDKEEESWKMFLNVWSYEGGAISCWNTSRQNYKEAVRPVLK